MPIRPCPECQRLASRLLEGISAVATVWYYRCPNCAHVWTVTKSDPDGPQTSVSEHPPKPKTPETV